MYYPAREVMPMISVGLLMNNYLPEKVCEEKEVEVAKHVCEGDEDSE